MPVDFETYSPDDGRIDLTEGTNAREILAILLEHRGVGFTPGELHEQTDVARGSINPTLARLEDAGLVRHKGEYWAVAEDGRLAAASAAVLGVEAVEDSYGEDWYGENPGWEESLPDLSGEDDG
jgi:DNA-binding transcriptional ArsR family regulator